MQHPEKEFYCNDNNKAMLNRELKSFICLAFNDMKYTLPAILVTKDFDQQHEATLLHHQLESLVIFDSDHVKTFPNILIILTLMPKIQIKRLLHILA